jgi:hypothetical protein
MINLNKNNGKGIRRSAGVVVLVHASGADGGIRFCLEGGGEGVALGCLLAAGVELEGEGQLGQGAWIEALFGSEVLGGFPASEEWDEGKKKAPCCKVCGRGLASRTDLEKID